MERERAILAKTAETSRVRRRGRTAGAKHQDAIDRDMRAGYLEHAIDNVGGDDPFRAEVIPERQTTRSDENIAVAKGVVGRAVDFDCVATRRFCGPAHGPCACAVEPRL